MLGKNLNFVGALEKEYSIGSDGQYFENGAYINTYKKNDNFMFKTDDIISIFFYKNFVKFFKNGTMLHSFNVGNSKEFFVAVTLFGLSPSIESTNPQLFSLCIPKEILEPSENETKKKQPRPMTMIPGSIIMSEYNKTKQSTPPPKSGVVKVIKKKTGSFGETAPIHFDNNHTTPIGLKEGTVITIKSVHGDYVSVENGALKLQKSVTSNSVFTIENNGNYIQLKCHAGGYFKVDQNPIIKVDKKGYGYTFSSPGFNPKYLGVYQDKFIESTDNKPSDFTFYVEIPVDNKTLKKESSEKLIPDDPMTSFENYFKSGVILSFKSYFGNFFHYSQNIPSVTNTESRSTQFIVEKLGNQYRFTNEYNIPIVCTTPNDYLFSVTEHSNPEINGYSLLSEGGRYLGISEDKKILLYTNDQCKETRFYPIKYDRFFGIGPFQQDSEIYLKSIFGFYLRYDTVLKISMEKTEDCKLTVEQAGQLFKFKNPQSGYWHFSQNLNDILIYIKDFVDPDKNGYSIITNGKYLGITQQGQLVLSNSCNTWETRFFPEVVKKPVFEKPPTLSNTPLKLKLETPTPNSTQQVAKIIVQPTNSQRNSVSANSWRFNKKLLEEKNWIEKTTYKILKLHPNHSEYQRITKHFDETKYKITHAYCVFNDSLEHLFAHRLENLSIRLTKDVFKPKYDSETNKESRLKTLERMNSYVEEEYKGVKILPVFHGCSKESVYEICETGFANLKLTDSGFFGTGFYGTTQSEYSCRVYGKGVTLLCYICIANAYPVVEDDMKKLIGKSNYLNYDAHYVPVYPKDMTKHILGKERTYYPIKGSQNPVYDEFVVFQESQIIPRYLIYYEPK